jgi:hypothetical protein
VSYSPSTRANSTSSPSRITFAVCKSTPPPADVAGRPGDVGELDEEPQGVASESPPFGPPCRLPAKPAVGRSVIQWNRSQVIGHGIARTMTQPGRFFC